MALEMAPAVIHLKETSTCRTIARLADPHGHRATWMGFSPDGARLAVVARTTNAIHLWDLRAIRAGLAKMNLDWKWPALDPPGETSPDSRLATIEIVPREPRDTAAARAQQAQEAIERGRLEVAANPESALARNRLAWNYLMAPETLRDAAAALPLAEKAVQLDPANPDHLNTLGVAYYRVGRFADAARVLERNIERLDDRALAHDLLFLAMSHHQLGDTAKARDVYERAVRWIEAQGQSALENHEELLLFLDEAEELLGIGEKKD
jgi:tetratricopeptide (TPR) repeat protein